MEVVEEEKRSEHSTGKSTSKLPNVPSNEQNIEVSNIGKFTPFSEYLGIQE